MEALPHRFQGVRICETENSKFEWRPFAVDAKEWIQYLEEQWSMKLQNQTNLNSGQPEGAHNVQN